jgi:AraC-like DNA-binding protein
MQKGKDVSIQAGGIQLIHHNCPGLERRSLTFKEHLLFIPLQGEIQIQMKESRSSLGAGKMMYLPPNTNHSFASSEHQGERLIVLMKPALWRSKVGSVFPEAILPLSHLAREILFYLLLHPKTGFQKSLVDVFLETLGEHLEMAGANSLAAPVEHLESRVKDFRVMAALEFMKSNLAKSLSMNEVAAKSGLSLRSLNRLTMEQTGLSPRHVLISYRVSKAQELFLSGKKNVTEVAFEVGYNSLSQFIEAFRNVSGQLPSEYARMASFQKD